MFFSPYRQDPPISRISRDEAGQPFGITGFFGEVIQLLQEGMNCTSVNHINNLLSSNHSTCRWEHRLIPPHQDCKPSHHADCTLSHRLLFCASARALFHRVLCTPLYTPCRTSFCTRLRTRLSS